MVNRAAAQQAVKLLGRDHAAVVIQLAKVQDQKELRWVVRTRSLNDELTKQILDSIRKNGRPSLDESTIIEFLFQHYNDIAKSAIDSTLREMKIVGLMPRLSAPKLPRSFEVVRKMYDRWKRTGRVPKVFRQYGKDIKEEYLKKVQKVWREYSDDFRKGNAATQENVLRKIKDAAKVGENRAKTIVRTETTNYYNSTRREIYDQSDAVTHYLFLAIRDQRTTKWCTDRVVEGKRGRHGLVYAKTDPLTAKETPACHWFCRSEMVPLSPYNPRHLKLIQDLSLARRNHACHPLPEGWN